MVAGADAGNDTELKTLLIADRSLQSLAFTTGYFS